MTQDILTIPKIKKDYKSLLFHNIKTILIIPIMLLLLIALIIYLFCNLERSTIFIVLEILIISPAVFGTYICLSIILESYKDYNNIKNEKFKIVTDKLIDSQEESVFVGSAFAASFSRPYTLEFSSYGQYYILSGENYVSSNLYSMGAKEVFNCSNIGDNFYLVIDNKERILLAYNTKLFELLD